MWTSRHIGRPFHVQMLSLLPKKPLPGTWEVGVGCICICTTCKRHSIPWSIQCSWRDCMTLAWMARCGDPWAAGMTGVRVRWGSMAWCLRFLVERGVKQGSVLSPVLPSSDGSSFEAVAGIRGRAVNQRVLRRRLPACWWHKDSCNQWGVSAQNRPL